MRILKSRSKRKSKNNNQGFTLVELLVAVAASTVIITATLQAYIMFSSYWSEATRDIQMQSSGRVTSEKIARDVRAADSVDVTDDSTDTTITTTSPGGVTATYNYDKSDKAIYYSYNDPANSYTVSNQIMIANVEAVGSQDVFEKVGDNLVNIQFRVVDQQTGDGYQGKDFTLSVFMRN